MYIKCILSIQTRDHKMLFSKIKDCFYFVYINYTNYSANIIFFLFFSPVSLFVLARPGWCLRFPSEHSLAILILNLIVISPAAVLSCLAMTPPTPGLWKAVSSFFVSPCLRSNEIQLSFTMICEVANGVDICSVNSEDRPFLFFPPMELKSSQILSFGLPLVPC